MLTFRENLLTLSIDNSKMINFHEFKCPVNCRNHFWKFMTWNIQSASLFWEFTQHSRFGFSALIEYVQVFPFINLQVNHIYIISINFELRSWGLIFGCNGAIGFKVFGTIGIILAWIGKKYFCNVRHAFGDHFSFDICTSFLFSHLDLDIFV